MSLLAISDMNVAYGPIEAVHGINLTVEAGEVVALLGANGAGKSSTLNGIIGLAPVKSGRISFQGEDITGVNTEQLVRRGMTMSPEGRRVFGALTVEDNLRLGGYTQKSGTSLAGAYDQVYQLFPLLAERRQQFAGTLSGGQQQMLAIGRALMSGPELLLLDEPSLGLAPRIVEQIFDLIATLRTNGVTILLVEQNVAMSLDVVDRAYLLASGRIVGEGSAADLKASSVVQDAYLGDH